MPEWPLARVVIKARLGILVKVDVQDRACTYDIYERALGRAGLNDGQLLLVTNAANLQPAQVEAHPQRVVLAGRAELAPQLTRVASSPVRGTLRQFGHADAQRNWRHPGPAAESHQDTTTATRDEACLATMPRSDVWSRSR